MNQIIKHSGFKAELALAETWDEINLIEAKANAVAEFARKEKIGLDEQNEWGRFRVEIKKRKGEFLEVKFPKGRSNQHTAKSDNTTLQDEGITKDESSNARVIFNNPELVEEAMDEIEDEGKIITPNAVTNVVRRKIEEIQKSDAVFNEQKNNNIEWAKWSWNPITGCLHNCPYCYARDIANRYYDYKFEPHFYPDRLMAAHNTKIPKGKENEAGYGNVFVCSMSDIMGEFIPEEWINTIIDIMHEQSQWNYLLLTKNPKRYLEFEWPKNCWIGATADTQKRATEAIKVFKKLNHPIKFLSCEPLEEKIILPENPSLQWIIIGGRSESTGMRAGQPEWDWVESLINQCRKYKIKVYGKPNLKALPKEYPL